MDKVIIFGVFEFLGFHFCNRLLEKGCCVKGVHFSMAAPEYVDEKRLEVGRNANFEEFSIQQSVDLIGSDDNPALIIFSLYDLFMSDNEFILNDNTVCESIFQLVKARNNKEDKIVYLLPIQLLTESRIKGRGELEGFIKQINEITVNEQFFYLPAIFGPWQPPEFIFQRAISNWSDSDKKTISEKEWVLDAIFIEDALQTILEIIEGNRGGSFLLESGVSDSWHQCADFLKLDQTYRGSCENLNINAGEKVIRLSLNHVTPYNESLSIQKEHFSQIVRMLDKYH